MLEALTIDQDLERQSVHFDLLVSTTTLANGWPEIIGFFGPNEQKKHLIYSAIEQARLGRNVSV